jgi:hypothetical protein
LYVEPSPVRVLLEARHLVGVSSFHNGTNAD